jgi:2-haloacid dehalogenase
MSVWRGAAGSAHRSQLQGRCTQRSSNSMKALIFDTFGTVVDWRTSLIEDCSHFGDQRGLHVDWVGLVDDWRAEYKPSMDRVRTGQEPWRTLDQLHRASLEQLLASRNIRGLTSEDLDYLVTGWHRLRPWPDAVPGLNRLRKKFIVGPLSNGNVALLVNLAKFAGLPWDVVFGTDLWQHYKPDSETYLGACRLLGLNPPEVMMVAAHNYDLRAASQLGLSTAFIPRPAEYGPNQTKDLKPEGSWDIVAADIVDLARQLA